MPSFMPFHYQSGEEIKRGDRVTYCGVQAEIELVADPLVPNPESDWYVQEFGGGVMVFEPEPPRKYGRVFLTETEADEDLVFVARGK